MIPFRVAVEAFFELAKAWLQLGGQVLADNRQQVVGVGVGQALLEAAGMARERTGRGEELRCKVGAIVRHASTS